ncbi:MAG: T9SS type A sorting domain-containing protein [Bacteroidota bacterium]
MKKFLLTLFALAGFSVAYSQCTPDMSQTQPGIHPDSATNFAVAYELTPYSQTITAVTPADTCVDILGPPFPCTTLSIDSIVVDSVTGLPSWATFTCAPPNCQFLGGTTDCAIITGTPPSGSAGTYPLMFYLNAYVGGSGVSNPFELDYYKIVVMAGTSVNENSGIEFAVKNIPNPFDHTTQIELMASENTQCNFEVMNVLGKQVYTKPITVTKGKNTFTFDGSMLAPGSYLYRISDGKKTITKRMVISR